VFHDWIDLSLWIEQLSVFHVCWIETVDVVVKVQERIYFTLIDTFQFWHDTITRCDACFE
jgi:hypothetical protein